MFSFQLFSTRYITHIVKKKETLWRISKTYNVAVSELCKINKITDITKIKYGAKIKIPIKEKQTEYYDYILPTEGEVRNFITAHFRGVVIFMKKTNSKSKVIAVDDGTVSLVKEISGFGLTLFLKLNNGHIATYSGFKELFVKEGNKITKGSILGNAGILSRYKRKGIIFSIQCNGFGLKYDITKQKFIKN